MQNSNLTNKTLHEFYKSRDYSLFGVIGNPVSHSQSPALHKEFLLNAGLSQKAEYIKINIKNPAELKNIILTMPKMGFIGCNITTPFKEQVFKIVAKLAHKGLAKLHSTANRMDAVNCLFFNPDTGIIEAYNTDATGFTTDLEDKKITFKTALVIGAGGASRAIIAGLLDLNIRRDLHISIINRTYNKAKNIQNHFRQELVFYKPLIRVIQPKKFEIHKPSIRAIQPEKLEIQDYDLIINTTSLGLKANEYPDIDYSKINKSAFCYDVIYPSDSPHSLTPFLQKCLDAGVNKNQLCNGYGMLFHQALESFKIWTEARIDWFNEPF